MLFNKIQYIPREFVQQTHSEKVLNKTESDGSYDVGSLSHFKLKKTNKVNIEEQSNQLENIQDNPYANNFKNAKARRQEDVFAKSNLNRIDSSYNQESSIVNMHFQEERDIPIRNI